MTNNVDIINAAVALIIKAAILASRFSGRVRKRNLKRLSSMDIDDKDKGYDPDNFSRDLRNANRKAGLQWTCLDFRHTFGSQLAMKGESLYKISALMGNSPEICRSHYAALIPEALAESVEFTESMQDRLIV